MITKIPLSIRTCKNVGASVGMGDLNRPQETLVVSSERKKHRKLKMWIACCGCGNTQSLFENIYDMKAEGTKITYYSRCPHCGYKHKIEVTKA